MFLTRSHHEDIIREKNLQIGYRDHRIAELEAERKLLWDKLCLLEIGEAVFSGPGPQSLGSPTCTEVVCGGVEVPSAAPNRHPEPSANCEVKDLNSPSSNAAPAQNDACGLTNHACNKSHPEPCESGTVKDLNLPSSAASKYVRLGRPRPSQIMRRMDRLMHSRWLQRIRPSKRAEQNGTN